MSLFYFLMFPFFSALLCFFLEFFNFCKSRVIAIFSIFFSFFLLLFIIIKNININNFYNEIFSFHRLEYCIYLIKNLGISFHLYLDELSCFMIFLSLILGFFSIISAWKTKKKENKHLISGLMLLLGSCIGIFLSEDLFLFFLFWELSIFTTYFLLICYGNKNFSFKKRVLYAKKFLIYSQISGFLLLFSIIFLSVNYFLLKGSWTFDFNILKTLNYDSSKYFFLMLSFFLAFIIKFPIIPFHNWILDFYKISPKNGSLDILGTLLKTSFYGILKFNIFLFPVLSFKFSKILVILSILNMFYSSFLAFKEKNLKRVLLYSSIAHVNFILLGIYLVSKNFYSGILLQVFSSSISFSILFLILGKIFSRKENFNFMKLHGLWNQLKYIPEFFLFFTVVNIGVPFNGNFLGEFLVLLGILKNYPYIVFLIICNLFLILLYYLKVFHKVFYGNSMILQRKIKIYKKDYFTYFFSAFLIIFSGFFPKLFCINFF